MKTKVKQKVTIDGQEREVEVEVDLNAVLTDDVRKQMGLMNQSEIGEKYTPKDAFQAELDRRVSSITKGMVKLEEIKEKPELRQQVFDMLGVKVTKDGQPQVTADQIAQLQSDWRKKELEPAVQRAEAAEKKSQKLLDRILEGEIVQAAATANVHKHLLQPVAQGQKPPIVTMLRDVFRYSPDHDGFFQGKGEDGFEFSSDPKTTGTPYKGVSEFVKDWATKKENAPFIDAAKPGGAGLNQPGGGAGGVATIEAPTDRPMTLQEYMAAQKSAGDEGRVVVKTAGES